MIQFTLLVASLVASSDNLSKLRKSWNLVPADPSRPGLMLARGLHSGGIDLLARVDTTAAGELLRCEWSAESGKREVDLPDDKFWSILDGFSSGKEWVETDPDALPDGVFEPPKSKLAQGFRCPACTPALVATTWSPFGATRLLVARALTPKAPPRLDVSPGVTEEGILSLARQRGFGVDGRNPCREGAGSCSLGLTGLAGEYWRFGRSSGSSSWVLERAGFSGSPWWNPDWSWDSLRTESPREFQLVLRNWLDAELDVIGAKLVRPLEPILSAGTADWNARTLNDLNLAPTLAKLVPLSSAPSSVILCEGKSLRVSIDAFGRRSLEILKDKK